MSGRRRPSRASALFPIEDIEGSVYERILVVSHVWPGVTPLNVWDLPYDMWLQFANGADEWSRQQKEASRAR